MAPATFPRIARGTQTPSGVNPKLRKELSDIFERSEKAEGRKNQRWGYRYVSPGVRIYGPLSN